MLVVALAAAAPAQATNYQDMWWNPNESGWGLNLTQQGDTVFAIWFVYDAGRRDTWFVAVCTLVDDRTCHGDLSVTTGPVYSALQFDPKGVTETIVGSATFTFADANHGTLTYTVSGVGVSKNIVRYSYIPPAIAGTYWIAGSGIAQGCDPSGDISYTYDNAGLVLAASGSQLDLALKLYNESDWNARYACNATGAFTQWGSQIAFSAPFSCSDGSSGTLTLPDFNITERGLAGKLRWNYGNCVETDNVAGVRHPASTTPGPGTIVLGATTYTVAESGGTVTVTVARTGGTSGSVTIGYATADGTARAGQDYTAVAGNVVFGDGDATTRTIAIPILSDTAVEGTETFSIVLTGPTGGASLGVPSTATITILDDDTGGDGVKVGPEGGSVTSGSAVVTVPAGAVPAGSTVTVNLVPATPDTSFLPGTELASDAYRLELTGDLQQPITLRLPAKSAPAGGELVLGAIVSDDFYSSFDPEPRRSIQVFNVGYADGKYSVTLPKLTAAGAKALAAKVLGTRALAGTSTFTVWTFTGHAQRSSAHFNIRYRERGCNAAIMDEWLQHAEEAYTRLVTNLGFTTYGTGLGIVRQDIDVVALPSGTYGEMGVSWNPLKNYWGTLDKFSTYFNLTNTYCHGGTAADQRGMEATIGHEFFHIVQATYEPAHFWLQKPLGGQRAQCLADASSTWFEGEMIDDPKFLGGPAADALKNLFFKRGMGPGCEKYTQSYGYGLSTFLRHLTAKYGPELILSIWGLLRDGSGNNVPVDHLKAANVRVDDEWEAFAPKLLTGSTGFGWPTPDHEPKPPAYSPGTPLTISGELPELSAIKYLIDFREIANPAKPPTCRAKLTKGAGRYAVGVYLATNKVAGLDQEFNVTATSYNLIVVNISDSGIVANGARYGEITPFEIAIDCTEPPAPCQSGNWEFSVSPVPAMEAFSCKLGAGGQTATLCITATNGVVSARGGTCYSRLQSASGTIAADGKFSVDFKWGGYGTSSLDGSGDSGEVIAGRFTGTMTGSCVMTGTVSGEYHAWSKSQPWCSSGYDIKQAYQSTGSSH